MNDDVWVACKLLHGIYLEVGKQRIRLNGILQSGRCEAPFFMTSANSVGLTKVPREFWEAWVKEYEEFKPFKQGLIFAADKKKCLLDEADEKAELKHGLERIDPVTLPQALEQVKAGQMT